VPSEEALERLDLAVRRAWEAKRGRSDVTEIVAAAAPAGVEPLTSRDAVGEGA